MMDGYMYEKEQTYKCRSSTDNSAEVFFVHGAIDLDILVGNIGDISVGIKFCWFLSENSSSSSFFFITAELNQRYIYPFCSLSIVCFMNSSGKVV